MANLTRRGFFKGMGAGLIVASASPTFAQSATQQTLEQASSAQVQVALDYLKTNQIGQFQLILDKVNSQLYLVNGRGKFEAIPVYHGKKKADDLATDNPGAVTPAGKGGLELFFNPNFGVTLDFLKGTSTKLSIHSEIGTENDSTPSKTSLGCIRVPPNKFEYLINFVMRAEHRDGGQYALDAAQRIADARAAGRALDEPIKTTVDIYILPELDTSADHTISMMQKQFGCSLDAFAKGPEFCPAAG